jgi:HSP20 family protein
MFSLMPWKKERNGSGAVATRTEHPLSLFRSEIDRVFDRFFGIWPTLEASFGGLGLDLEEGEADVIVRIDAPGFEPEDFDIQVSGEMLRISAVRKVEKNKEVYSERRLDRSVMLPAPVNVEKVEALYRNGVLELRLPKTEQARWRKIEVKSN